MPLYLLLDTAVIGRLGSAELAALAAGTTVQSTVTTQLTFLSYGTTARSSRLYGQGQRDKAIAEGVQATWVGLSVGLILATIVWVFAYPIALGLTGEPDTAERSAAWLHVSAFAIPLTLIVMAGNGWLRGIQNTKWPLYFTLAGVVPGAVAIPIFVDMWGLVGSAAANVLGVTITASCFLVALRRQHRGSWRPKWAVMKRQLVLGRDLILRSLSFQVAFISAAAVAARVSVVALAAHQIMLQLWNFITLVLDSLAIAAQTLTGSALGSGNTDNARKVGQKVTLYSMIFSLGLAAVFGIGAGAIQGIFTSEQAVLEQMQTPWWLLLIMIVLGGVVFALDGVLLGASDAVFLRNLTILSVLLGFLPGVWISHLVGGGLTGIWIGLLSFILIRFVGVILRFKSMAWATTELVES
ncbi:MATE family efflux transporter [Corynebacterium breve]